ncbi:MAG: thiamine diphosphokinase [Firmicutes bacterium]|nr:thiamine diphosphokinase [Bacillota bacterium]
MSKKAAIFGSGSFDPSGVDFDQYRFIAGCDGGTQYLSDAGVVPHMIMGDFDSLDTSTIMEMFMLGVARHGLSADKDFTDMKGTVDFIAKLDYDELDIYGATGTRLDHSVGNMMLLFELFEKGLKCRIIDKNNIITAISAADAPVTMEINDVPQGWYVSFVPVGTCKGVTIKGMKYETEGIELGINNSTRAISNECAESSDVPASITVESGRLLVFYSRD